MKVLKLLMIWVFICCISANILGVNIGNVFKSPGVDPNMKLDVIYYPKNGGSPIPFTNDRGTYIPVGVMVYPGDYFIIGPAGKRGASDWRLSVNGVPGVPALLKAPDVQSVTLSQEGARLTRDYGIKPGDWAAELVDIHWDPHGYAHLEGNLICRSGC